jgi:hypothetical protein
VVLQTADKLRLLIAIGLCLLLSAAAFWLHQRTTRAITKK